MTIIPDFPDLLIKQVYIANEITLTLRTTSPTAACPCCGTLSKRVHSRYTRTLHDLPSSGRPLRLVVQVRRFICSQPTCARRIFAEQIQALARPHAQRAQWLQTSLCQLGLAIGGQAGARVGSDLGISGSRDTILRLVCRYDLPAPKEAHAIGVDDWAWKRRLCYGTLICDLESGLPLELLPDRSVETVSAWLQDHPRIELVSRDGSSEYASAIAKDAPQARQVADRWHLTRGLADCVSVLLAEVLAEFRQAEQAQARAEGEGTASHPEWRPRETRAVQHAQSARHAERLARYEQISTLRQQGWTSADIAAQVGMAERTVRHWLARGTVPDYKHRWKRASRIEPYQAYLLERWRQGCRNGLQLLSELQARGYHGSQRSLYRYLATLKPAQGAAGRHRAARSNRQGVSSPTPHPLLTLSVQQATWLFMRRQAELNEEEVAQLRQLRQASSKAEPRTNWLPRFSKWYESARESS